MLKLHIIIVIEVVETQHDVAFAVELQCCVKSDEPRSARQKYHSFAMLRCCS